MTPTVKLGDVPRLVSAILGNARRGVEKVWFSPTGICHLCDRRCGSWNLRLEHGVSSMELWLHHSHYGDETPGGAFVENLELIAEFER